jgi:hypothetical protein
MNLGGNFHAFAAFPRGMRISINSNRTIVLLSRGFFRGGERRLRERKELKHTVLKTAQKYPDARHARPEP